MAKRNRDITMEGRHEELAPAARLLRALEVPALIAVPAVMGACAFAGIDQAALLTLLVVVVSVGIFFAGFEASRPSLRQLMPTVVLGALAAAGRILFAPLPDVKPVSAICIMAGVVFGKRSGFLVGAMAALVSNFFFGQGPWTPWQMYSWGLVGYLAGVLASKGAFDWKIGSKQFAPILYVFGLLSGLLYGFLMNSWYIIGFVKPLNWVFVTAAYFSGLPFDLVHSAATVAFLLVLYEPWKIKLERIKRKYDVKG